MFSKTEFLVRFGARVRERREARGFSQEVFAERCDFDRTYISGIERGKRNISIASVKAIALALEISLSELLNDL